MQSKYNAKHLWLLVPVIAFYAILTKNAVNLPFLDDSHAVVEFTNQQIHLHGTMQRIIHLLTFQHNEYKLMFESAVFALQYSLFGHVNFYVLDAIGNAFVVGIFVLLLVMYKQKNQVLLLLPISLMLFQLQYASTLNWAMAGLQNFPVIFFSLLAIILLTRRSSWACVSMVLAVASSGNGFMVIPVGGILLLQQRRFKALAIWSGVSMAMAALYFWRYNFHSSQSVPGASVTHSMLHLNPGYALSFMGASIAGYHSCAPSIALGLILCLVIFIAVRMKYYETNPAVFYSILFILVTAIGTSGLRSDFGIAQSLASRYRIYSNLLLILSYMFLTETFRFSRPALKWVVAACLIFCAGSDYAGAKFLYHRRAQVEHLVASAGELNQLPYARGSR